jgi:hypothetical protein
MPIAQRDSLLISIAKEAVLVYKHGPSYYREYKEPIIERGQIPQEGILNLGGYYPERYFYVVTFPYDSMEEASEWDSATRVGIWEDTGRAEYADFGNGYGWELPEAVIPPIIGAYSFNGIELMYATLSHIKERRRIVSGIVFNEDNEPLSGAEIREVGTRNGTYANIDGTFILTTRDTSEICISIMGCDPEYITITSDTVITVTLKDDGAVLCGDRMEPISMRMKGNPQSVKTIHYKSINLTDTPTKEDIDYTYFREINRKGNTTVSWGYFAWGYEKRVNL